MYGDSFRNDLPPELDAVVNRFEDKIGDLRTLLIREQDAITQPQDEPADPDRVRAAAEADDASPELKAVASAVAKGRTTWADAVAGKADHLPEVQAFYTSMRERMVAELDAQAEQDQQPTEAPRTELDESAEEGAGYMYMPKPKRGTHTGWQTSRDDEQSYGFIENA